MFASTCLAVDGDYSRLMTDWNERYLSEDTPWEKGRPAPPLLELLERKGAEIWGSGTVLVPGCGTGHDVRALAAAGQQVLGLDLAEEAIGKANTHPKSGNEEFEKGDFLDPSWQAGKSFSAIWEHTCFCAINPTCRQAYAEACANLIPAGGHLVGVFFLTAQEPGHEGEGPPFNSTIPDLDARFGPWFERIDAWVPKNSFPGREGDEWIAIYRRK